MAQDNLWKDAEHQLKELDLDLEDEEGNNPWDAAAENEVKCFSFETTTEQTAFLFDVEEREREKKGLGGQRTYPASPLRFAPGDGAPRRFT